MIAEVLRPETILYGKYVIRGPLESGGMGDVYDAWQIDLSRAVAIKVLRGDLVPDESSFVRFRREAEAAASLGHPNIVQIFDFRNEAGEQPILVMEKLEGRSLRALLAGVGTLAPPRAVFIALQILSALGAAHDAKIVHRDVKPANVFVLSTFAVRDFVKVLDFGVAKVLGGDGFLPALTALGQVVGTASYMAPEQAKGLEVDGRADLFAVGVILFEALSGKRPRTLGPAMLHDAGTMPCLLLRDVLPSVDPRLAAVVDRALALDRQARFPSAKTMAEALAPFAPQELIQVGHSARAAPTVKQEASADAVENTVTASTMSAPETTRHPSAQPARDAGHLPTQLSPGPRAASDAPAPPLPAVPATSPPAPSHALAPPPPHPRRPPPMPAAPLGSGRWSGLIYAVPVLGMVGALVIGVVAIIVYLERSIRRDVAFVRAATPSHCEAPASCTAVVQVHAQAFSSCAPASALTYRAGDIVFVANGSSALPVRVVAPTASGQLSVESVEGNRSDVAVTRVSGPYCNR